MNLIARLFVKAHAGVYRLSGGRMGSQMGRSSILLLHSVGRKSGQKRTHPLVYFEDSDNYVLIASNGGAPKHPAWYHNLRANPDTTVQIEGNVISVKAEMASATERQRLWDRFVPDNPQFQGYQDKTDREIQIFVLKSV